MIRLIFGSLLAIGLLGSALIAQAANSGNDGVPGVCIYTAKSDMSITAKADTPTENVYVVSEINASTSLFLNNVAVRNYSKKLTLPSAVSCTYNDYQNDNDCRKVSNNLIAANQDRIYSELQVNMDADCKRLEGGHVCVCLGTVTDEHGSK